MGKRKAVDVDPLHRLDTDRNSSQAVDPPSPLKIDRGQGEELEWEAEEVLDSRRKYSKIYYKVRWKGGETSEQPWSDLLPGCDELVAEFHARCPDKVGPPAEFKLHCVDKKSLTTDDVAVPIHETNSFTRDEEHPAHGGVLPSSFESAQDAPILRLPQELIDEIASYLHPRPAHWPYYQDGFLAFRATCKELRCKTEQLLGPLCFSTRSFLLSDERSLHALLKISKHPIYSKTMKRIEFSLAKVQDLLVEGCHDDRNEDCKWSENNDDEDWCSERAGADYRVWRNGNEYWERKSIEWCKRRIHTQWAFRDASSDLQYLCAILENFKAAHNNPSLIVGTAPITGFARVPSSTCSARIQKKIPPGNHTPFRSESGYVFDVSPCDHRAFKIIFNAIRSTSYPIQDLQLGYSEIGTPLSFKHFRP